MAVASLGLGLVLALASPPDTLVVGVLSEPVSLDPHRATDVVSAAVVASVCEPLVRFRPDGERPEAALATTWATVDARTWTFTLREGVRFHDGSPLDADAVIANLASLRRERAFAGRAERVGRHVVSITLDRPNAALLATLSQPFFAIQSPRELARGPGGRPVGTGPFRLAEARPGEVRLAASPDYWGGPPRLRHLVFRRYAGEQALIEALLAGQVDFTASLGHGAVARLHEEKGVSIDSQTGLNIAFLSVNNERRPLDDRRVRLAIAKAVDRRALVRELLDGQGEPARNPLPPSLWGYGMRTKELIQDLPAARRLLREAGYPDGFEAVLMAVDAPRPYNPHPLQLAERLRADLAAVGIRARLDVVPTWAEYLARGSRGEYDLAVMGWQADSTDPNDFLLALLASESIGATNRSRYASAQMDTLLKRGRRGAASGERLSAYRSAQELFQRDMPWVPLYHVPVFTAYRSSVRGLTLAPTGIVRFDKVWKAP